jgi:hypothetical protein
MTRSPPLSPPRLHDHRAAHRRRRPRPLAAAATQCFTRRFASATATAQQQDAAGAFDSAISALRDDVWVAPEIAATEPTIAKLGKVTWTIQETALTRDARR